MLYYETINDIPSRNGRGFFFLKSLLGGTSKIWAGTNSGTVKELSLSGHTHSEYAPVSHTHSASDITSGTLRVSNGGTGVTSLSALASAIQPYLDTPGTGSVIDGNLTLGNTVKFDGMYWIVCHLDYVSKKAYLACTVIVEDTKFGSNNTYSSSTLKNVAKSFENSMSDGAKSRMLNTTVNGVTSKIFVASHDQMDGDFSYFNSDERRVCQNQTYWTSSPSDSRVWIVGAGGGLSGYMYGPSSYFGFRPFCAVSLT